MTGAAGDGTADRILTDDLSTLTIYQLEYLECHSQITFIYVIQVVFFR
jgi:hypothetical protein